MVTTYSLGDAFTNDPFQAIFKRKRDILPIFDPYSDYEQYWNYLKETWLRLRDDYEGLGNAAKVMFSYMESGQQVPMQVHQDYRRASRLFQMDSEVFIIFANRFMDKVGKL